MYAQLWFNDFLAHAGICVLAIDLVAGEDPRRLNSEVSCSVRLLLRIRVFRSSHLELGEAWRLSQQVTIDLWYSCDQSRPLRWKLRKVTHSDHAEDVD